jgi:hypothetical protein
MDFVYIQILFIYIYIYVYIYKSSSSVGIVNRYRLNGPEIEPRSADIFPTRPEGQMGSLSLIRNGYRVFSGVNTAGTCPWTPSSYTADVKERGQQYLYSLSELSLPLIGRTLTLSYIHTHTLNYLLSTSFHFSTIIFHNVRMWWPWLLFWLVVLLEKIVVRVLAEW